MCTIHINIILMFIGINGKVTVDVDSTPRER